MSNRNLSSTKQSNRQAMRKCRGLIDSLVRYIKDSVDAGKPDNRVNKWGEGIPYRLPVNDVLALWVWIHFFHSRLNFLGTPSWEREQRRRLCHCSDELWFAVCRRWLSADCCPLREVLTLQQTTQLSHARNYVPHYMAAVFFWFFFCSHAGRQMQADKCFNVRVARLLLCNPAIFICILHNMLWPLHFNFLIAVVSVLHIIQTYCIVFSSSYLLFVSFL